ncbi:MAG: hypothetical protein WC455_11785 [Dehalococcoidia bacterium]|jgi:hypothetical protein
MAVNRESFLEQQADALLAGTPGVYPEAELVRKMAVERTGIDLDQFSATDNYSVCHRHGNITIASIMRMARLTRPQRDMFRLIVNARRNGIAKIRPSVAARVINIHPNNVNRMIKTIISRVTPVINSLDGEAANHSQSIEWLFWRESRCKLVRKHYITHKRKTVSDTMFYIEDGQVKRTKRIPPLER